MIPEKPLNLNLATEKNLMNLLASSLCGRHEPNHLHTYLLVVEMYMRTRGPCPLFSCRGSWNSLFSDLMELRTKLLQRKCILPREEDFLLTESFPPIILKKGIILHLCLNSTTRYLMIISFGLLALN